jgi:hypothetical protein
MGALDRVAVGQPNRPRHSTGGHGCSPTGWVNSRPTSSCCSRPSGRDGPTTRRWLHRSCRSRISPVGACGEPARAPTTASEAELARTFNHEFRAGRYPWSRRFATTPSTPRSR